MTEIPEHLLKRAAERRAAMTGGEAPADAPADAAPSAAAPAADAPAAAPAKKAPAPLPTLDDEPAKEVPDIPVVAAAKSRKRVPYWAAALLASLPLWGFMYYFAIAEPPAGDSDPFVIGEAAYSGCVGCHGGDGGGTATGEKLNGGEVIATFPDPIDMVHWIYYGYQGHARPDGTYGDPNREGGVRTGQNIGIDMPAQQQLSAEDLAAVTIYVREELSEGDPAEDPNFNSELFVEDHAAVVALAQAAIDLGEGPPDLSQVEGAETDEG